MGNQKYINKNSHKMSEEKKQLNIIFVIGGPGSGKGTLCQSLSKKHKFAHYSAGDLLRAEAASGSERGKMIAEIQKEGKLVPSEITVELIKKAIDNDKDAVGFLIDGFPRNIEQAEIFEKGIAMAQAIVNLEADETAMTERILARAATSGRSDDNVEALKKRFATHRESCEPVIAYYEKVGRVKTINANGTVEEVYTQAMTLLELKDN